MENIPLSKVYVTDKIRSRIDGVVDSGQFILGPESKSFEKELADFLEVDRFVLSSSWTSAVHLLLDSIGFEPGSEVLLPSLTAFPSVEPVVHAGLKPVFVDIDDTYCMDPEDLERKITDKSVAVLPVHLYGQPADMDRITAIASSRNLTLIEDCAQAIGAKHAGRRVGSIGAAGGFSFYPSKNLTVYGDGGGICTNDSRWAERVISLRNHGRKTKYENESFGFNMRFNEIQAAVGRCQLEVIDELNGERRRVAAIYDSGLAEAVETPKLRPNVEHVYHMYVIALDHRDELAGFLKERGISTGIHYPVPVHMQPAVTNRFGRQTLPATERAVKRILSLPMFPELSEQDAGRVVDAIRDFTEKHK